MCLFQLSYSCISGSLRCTAIEGALRNSIFSLRLCCLTIGGRKMVRTVCVSPQRLCIFVLLVLVSAVLTWAGPATAPAEPPESVVAIGDIHNDFEDRKS